MVRALSFRDLGNDLSTSAIFEFSTVESCFFMKTWYSPLPNISWMVFLSNGTLKHEKIHNWGWIVSPKDRGFLNDFGALSPIFDIIGIWIIITPGGVSQEVCLEVQSFSAAIIQLAHEWSGRRLSDAFNYKCLWSLIVTWLWLTKYCYTTMWQPSSSILIQSLILLSPSRSNISICFDGYSTSTVSDWGWLTKTDALLREDF